MALASVLFSVVQTAGDLLLWLLLEILLPLLGALGQLVVAGLFSVAEAVGLSLMLPGPAVVSVLVALVIGGATLVVAVSWLLAQLWLVSPGLLLAALAAAGLIVLVSVWPQTPESDGADGALVGLSDWDIA